MITKLNTVLFRHDGGQRSHTVEKTEWQSGKRLLNTYPGDLRFQERDDLVGPQPAHMAKFTGTPGFFYVVVGLDWGDM
jgi:hypothetical protein